MRGLLVLLIVVSLQQPVRAQSCSTRDIQHLTDAAASADAASIDDVNDVTASLLKMPKRERAPWRFSSLHEARAYYDPIVRNLYSCAKNADSDGDMEWAYLNFAFASELYSDALLHYGDRRGADAAADNAITISKAMLGALNANVPAANPVRKVLLGIVAHASRIKRMTP